MTKIFLPLALAMACIGSLHAIKITVPDQYEEQIRSAKEAEQKEMERTLDAVDEDDSSAAPISGAESGEASGESSGGSSGEESDLQFSLDGSESGDEPGSESASGDFMSQSLEEASRVASEFEEDAPEGQGFVSGQVLDKETQQPVSGVAIVMEGTDVGTITDAQGRYTLGPAPAGEYTLSFVKSGYIESNVTEYAIAAGEVAVFPFALPPRPAEMSDEVYVLQDFSVTAEEANQMMLNLDLRMDSDSIMDVLGSEDLSRFADSDVASAVKRVAGVSVQDGKFAVIRGLDER
ncbi:MAG: carboxypeptidase-like regulatory domain-containing protein, partial [Opitutales bacterium]